mmetsp:Transcript_13949/g.35933  ORF Transcript_13949/g.35933 Transcript_13949/m.35933 type:complete len:98 (+) Transcript_13949:240-533(+)
MELEYVFVKPSGVVCAAMNVPRAIMEHRAKNAPSAGHTEYATTDQVDLEPATALLGGMAVTAQNALQAFSGPPASLVDAAFTALVMKGGRVLAASAT